MSALRKNPGFSIGSFSKTLIFRLYANNLYEDVRIREKPGFSIGNPDF